MFSISFETLTKGEPIGQGGFGVVYKGTYQFAPAAIKQLHIDNLSPDAEEEFNKEAAIMAQLHHPNVVHFYGYCTVPKCLVMEYMPKGSLFSVLHNKKEPLDWNIRMRIATDMASGLAFLHSRNILHRDIKSLNVLLDDQRAKLTDFGLSQVKNETKSQTTANGTSKDSVGTVQWMAPELFKRKAVYTQKADIYSLGITFWELSSRKIPYFKDTQAAIPTFVQQGEREDIPVDCPEKLAYLIQQCWEGSPEARPSAADIARFMTTDAKTFQEVQMPSKSVAVKSGGYQNNFHSAPQPSQSKNPYVTPRAHSTSAPVLAVPNTPKRRSSNILNLTDKKEEQEKIRYVLEALRDLFSEERDDGEKTENYAKYNEYLKKAHNDARLVYREKQNKHVLVVNNDFLDSETATKEISKMLKSLAVTSISAKPIASPTGQSPAMDNAAPIQAAPPQMTSPVGRSPSPERRRKSSVSPPSRPRQNSRGRRISLDKANSIEATTQAVAPAALPAVKVNPSEQNPPGPAMLSQFQEFITKPSPQKNTNDLKELGEFLKLVAEGEQDKAEAMLMSNPVLALLPGDVTDLSQRTFNGITGFQYAVWALDWHMWTMILKYFPEDNGEEARNQAKKFNTGSWVKNHGVRANLDTLIEAYQTSINLYKASEFKGGKNPYAEADKSWVEQIGRQQLFLPAHVINEYCHPTRPFYPIPNFKDALPLPRSRIVNKGKKEWFDDKVGKTCAYYRGDASSVQSFAFRRDGESVCEWLEREQECIRALSRTRTAQQNELSAKLRPKNTIPKVDQKEAEEFLRLVTEGEQSKAEAMLRSNPDLAFASGEVNDLSERIFKGITAFQYAVWALDWHMWTMIRKYLSDDAVREQAEGFETGSWVKSHGVHAQHLLDNLAKALQLTIHLYDAKKWSEGNTAWVQQVGGAQRLLPAHVINEYCHPTRPFDPLPNFKDAVPLPRSRKIHEGKWFTAVYNGGKLGDKFAVDRGKMSTPMLSAEMLVRQAWSCCIARGFKVSDHASIRALSSTRTTQREELIAELKPKIAQRHAA